MTDCTVYFNPECSKSRALLALLDARGIAARLVDYRNTPPGAAELEQLIERLGDHAHELLRRDDPEFALLTDDERRPDAAATMAALQRFPQLMQRPVVVRGERALIARPPERALDLF